MIQEFYDIYGIKEGDGMYVPAEDRIQIWYQKSCPIQAAF